MECHENTVPRKCSRLEIASNYISYIFLVKKQAFTNSDKCHDVLDSTTDNILQIFERFSSTFTL